MTELANVEARINDARKRLEAKKNELNKAEAQLEMHQKQLADVTEQIKAAGHEPEQLPQVIDDLEKRILDDLKEAERILNEADAEPTPTDGTQVSQQ